MRGVSLIELRCCRAWVARPYRAPTRGSLSGLVKAVLKADPADRPRMMVWLQRKLGEHVAVGTLTTESATGILHDTAKAAGLEQVVGK